MKTIIAGTRTIDNIRVIELAIEQSGFQSEITGVVSGKQKTWDRDRKIYTGADYYGEQWASKNNIPIQPFPADWNQLGLSAGPIRNRQMAEYADALIAIWDGKSRRTKNMIDEASSRGLRVFVWRVGNELGESDE